MGEGQEKGPAVSDGPLGVSEEDGPEEKRKLCMPDGESQVGEVSHLNRKSYGGERGWQMEGSNWRRFYRTAEPTIKTMPVVPGGSAQKTCGVGFVRKIYENN